MIADRAREPLVMPQIWPARADRPSRRSSALVAARRRLEPMDSGDRRAAGVKRVPIERVVEICGRDERVPAFEAESVELSGRGMLVRTPYLPELGAPIVCRLEDQG